MIIVFLNLFIVLYNTSAHSMRQPDLQEVIDFLSSPDDSTKASAAAHLQHLVYMDDAMKAKTR